MGPPEIDATGGAPADEDPTNPYRPPIAPFSPAVSDPPPRPGLTWTLLIALAMGIPTAFFGWWIGYNYPISPDATESAHLRPAIFDALLLGLPSVVAGIVVGAFIDRQAAAGRQREANLRHLKADDCEPTFDFDAPEQESVSSKSVSQTKAAVPEAPPDDIHP